MTNAPTCARHPDRETWVSCSRCGNPICPDCMNEAPVGFHCPACIAEGKRTVRQIKVRTAKVTSTLIGICVVAFLYGEINPRFDIDFGVAGYPVFELGEYYRLVTAMFLHAGIIHIAFNMLVLHQLGTPLELKLGSAKFSVIYFVSGLGGSIASVLFNNPLTLSVGASGAIFGLMGAYFVVARSLRLDAGQIRVMIGINLVIGFVIPGIDWHGHLGGLAAGAAVTALIHKVFPSWG